MPWCVLFNCLKSLCIYSLVAALVNHLEYVFVNMLFIRSSIVLFTKKLHQQAFIILFIKLHDPSSSRSSTTTFSYWYALSPSFLSSLAHFFPLVRFFNSFHLTCTPLLVVPKEHFSYSTLHILGLLYQACTSRVSLDFGLASLSKP